MLVRRAPGHLLAWLRCPGSVGAEGPPLTSALPDPPRGLAVRTGDANPGPAQCLTVRPPTRPASGAVRDPGALSPAPATPAPQPARDRSAIGSSPKTAEGAKGSGVVGSPCLAPGPAGGEQLSAPPPPARAPRGQTREEAAWGLRRSLRGRAAGSPLPAPGPGPPLPPGCALPPAARPLAPRYRFRCSLKSAVSARRASRSGMGAGIMMPDSPAGGGLGAAILPMPR